MQIYKFFVRKMIVLKILTLIPLLVFDFSLVIARYVGEKELSARMGYAAREIIAQKRRGHAGCF